MISSEPIVKKPRLTWTEVKKSISSAKPEYFYYPHKWLDDSNHGGLLFPLVDREGTIDPVYKTTVERNNDLSLLTMYLPINKLDYPQTYKNFWKEAIKLPHIDVLRDDIYITILTTIECFVTIAINDKGDLSSVKCNLEMPVKYVLAEKVYEKYTKVYNILDASQGKFLKRRLFNLKGCLQEYGNVVPLNQNFLAQIRPYTRSH